MKQQTKTIKRGRPTKFSSVPAFDYALLKGIYKKSSQANKPRREVHDVNGLAGFVCKGCGKLKITTNFYCVNRKLLYFDSICKNCRRKATQKYWKSKDPIAKRAATIKAHASRDKIPVERNLETALRSLWAKYPDGKGRCAYTGTELNLSDGFTYGDWDWTIDRIIPELGYVKGNMVICSNIINKMKQNSTVSDFISSCISVVRYFAERGITTNGSGIR